MLELNLSADDLVRSLLNISKEKPVFLLDSANVRYLGSHLLIAGINPLETVSLSHEDPYKTLDTFDEKLADQETANIFTISYDFGLKLENIAPRDKTIRGFIEPDIYLATFDTLIFHDYLTGKTFLKGNEKKYNELSEQLLIPYEIFDHELTAKKLSTVSSNFSEDEYISAVKMIQELIRSGETYQTNLTQQFSAHFKHDLAPQTVFSNLRKQHPAAFSAFLRRDDDYVLSISPERFAKVTDDKITTSPIKGTSRRGTTPEEDAALKSALLASEKDRAENTMIVDLLRNDIGKVCEFGTVNVEKLCELEVHPTLLHLVSTVSGTLRKGTSPGEIIKAIFPCGSITGCPKIRTMKIIDEIETANRALSMGAIGYCDFDNNLDLSVAIRTMQIRGRDAVFNVGGGIVIDSDPQNEYEESLLKAEALLKAIKGALSV